MTHTNKGPKTHLFQVEILVEGDTNAKALENLLHVLNNGGFPDFRVLSGSELGRLIEQLQQVNASAQSKSTKSGSASQSGKSSNAAKTANATIEAPAANPFALIAAQFREYMEQKKLIRLRINKGLGVSLNIPGRIINIDEDTALLTVYHVDEKQVYTFKLNEIDDFSI